MMHHVYFIFVKRVVGGAVGLTFFLCVVILESGLSNETNQPALAPITLERMAQARKILHEGTKIKPDDIAAITFSEEDLNLAGNYLLNRYHQSAIFIEVVNSKVRCNMSFKLPANTMATYFNISFRLGSEEGETLPHIAKFKVGNLLLPAKLADWVIHALIRYSFLNEYFILATTPIRRVEIADRMLTIFYDSDAPHHTANPESRKIYQQKITEIIAQHNPKWRLSLAEVLKAVFELAYQRAILETAVEENRSAILAVNDYVNSEKNPLYPPFLYKRIDLAQHFIGAAALTASTNRRVANALGEVKELSDRQAGGSGFSFVDLATDKAGSRFGELAVSSPENARRIQKSMTQIKDYRDLMPDPRDLPENMNETEFKRMFESTQSLAYSTLATQIDNRITLMPIYRQNDMINQPIFKR